MKGSISAKIKTGGGLDENGNPIPVTYTWGPAIECKYRANELSNKGRYVDGMFQQASYVITIEDMDFNADVVKLFNSKDNEVCVKEVISLEVLEDIQRVKVMV
jgi:hypothetical protein